MKNERAVCEALMRLTPTQRGVFKLLAVGHSNKGIAADFGLSEKTIEWHRKMILTKLNLKTPVQMAHLALKLHLVENLYS